MTDLFTELLDSITNLPITEDYSPKDRYADFRQLFTGSEQGKRVYRELLVWTKYFSTSLTGDPIDPLRLAVLSANRDFGSKLISTVNIEPLEQPTKANRKKRILYD